MGRGTAWSAAIVALAVSGCGGGKADGGPKAAAAAAQDFAAQVRKPNAQKACDTLTAASERAVARLSKPGAKCAGGLLDFLEREEVTPGLTQATALTATVKGKRARVTGTGLTHPLTTARDGDGPWRVSLVGLPGIRQDLAAADACGTYLKAADAAPLPPIERAALARALRTQADAVARLRGRLRALRLSGPGRPGLLDLTRDLAHGRVVLLHTAARVAAGGDIPDAIPQAGTVDRYVRRALSQFGTSARVRCPGNTLDGYEIQNRAQRTDKVCERLVKDLNGARGTITGLDEARARERRLAAIYQRARAGLAHLPAAEGLAHVRREALAAAAGASGAAKAMERVVPGPGALDRIDALIATNAARGTQLITAFVRLGATCY